MITRKMMTVNKAARTNPPMKRPPPAAGEREPTSHSVQALVTVSGTPWTVMEKGTCPISRPVMTEAVSVPSSFEYSTVAV